MPRLERARRSAHPSRWGILLAQVMSRKFFQEKGVGLRAPDFRTTDHSSVKRLNSATQHDYPNAAECTVAVLATGILNPSIKIGVTSCLAGERPTFLLQTARDTTHTRFWRHHDALPHHTSLTGASRKPASLCFFVRNVEKSKREQVLDIKSVFHSPTWGSASPFWFGWADLCKRYANHASTLDCRIKSRHNKVVTYGLRVLLLTSEYSAPRLRHL
jgi:hypothetical protein